MSSTPKYRSKVKNEMLQNALLLSIVNPLFSNTAIDNPELSQPSCWHQVGDNTCITVGINSVPFLVPAC